MNHLFYRLLDFGQAVNPGFLVEILGTGGEVEVCFISKVFNLSTFVPEIGQEMFSIKKKKGKRRKSHFSFLSKQLPKKYCQKLLKQNNFTRGWLCRAVIHYGWIKLSSEHFIEVAQAMSSPAVKWWEHNCQHFQTIQASGDTYALIFLKMPDLVLA